MNYLIECHYYLYEMIHFVGIYFYFLLLIVLTNIFSDICNSREKAMFITSVLVAVYYFFNRVYLNYAFTKDIAIKNLLFISSAGNLNIYIGILRLAILCVCLQYISMSIYNRKDIYDKK